MKKLKQYKGYIIAEGDGVHSFYIFTKDEWSMGQGFRYPEWGVDTLEEAEEWISDEVP